jgi:preprotein translocase subunit SecA
MAARLARFDPSLPPIPGLVWGRYPQRLDAPGAASTTPAATALVDAVRAALAAGLQRLGARAARRRAHERLLEVRAQQRAWQACDAATHGVLLQSLRARLARDGWGGALRAEALGCVAAAGRRALGRDPFDSQLLAAGVLLDDRFAEMATGEGKTYAAALAAAVAALAGVPVHVLTANDYLAQRDAQQLEPLFAALGLSVGTVLATSSPEQRRVAYACALTYCTAREVAFDYLRDGLATAASAPRGTLLRGLCMAILDEADSLLIDEATLPLVLCEPIDDAQQRAACFQALALARELQAGRDLRLDPATGRVDWLDAGVQRLEALSRGLDGGPWRNRRHRQDLVGAAFEALHRLERDRDYVVRDGKVELLDAVTGRAAPGRVWSRGLQTLVELKEGCAPSPATTTRAQISYQRFFARYLRLCGMSGTLAECRGEIRASTGREVLAIELRLPPQRRVLRERLFVDAARRGAAVSRRVAALQAAGRPVLIGTDSVAESQALSARLAVAGVAHRVLNAHHDRAEAEIVAQAGQRGAVTVATRMAGRGTDIVLGPGVTALGGLHVLNCQDNPSRRLDRQLIGRGARQGDPGSAETWRTLDAPHWRCLSSVLARVRKPDDEGAVPLAPRLVRLAAAWLQARDQTRQARQRSRLLEQDRQWERQLGSSTHSG